MVQPISIVVVGACEHLISIGTDTAADPTPAAEPGALCPDCAAEGVEAWAHLRMCLECGHVGCCDSSPMRHATGHFQATHHPVITSAEPGEEWRWCYVDQVAA